MNYNSSLLRPPGPVVNIVVRPMRRFSPLKTLPAELDTGADITVIPESLAVELQLKPKEPVLMLGYDENRVKRPTYRVDLEINEYVLHAIRVVAAPRDTILLGRDVLNHFVITLDGKAQTFEMVDP